METLPWSLQLLVAQCAGYTVWKYLLRLYMRQTDPDSFNQAGVTGAWGRETFIAALGHQLFVCLLVGLRVVTQPSLSDLNTWLHSSWDSGADFFWEEFVLTALAVECITDCFFYAHYGGWDRSYTIHHVGTVLASICYLYFQGPVGIATSFAAVIELGGASLNIASLFPSPAMYDMRTVVYTLSRVGATCFCALSTYGTLQARYAMPTWTQLPPWAILAVNWRWICVMLSKQVERRRRPGKKSQ